MFPAGIDGAVPMRPDTLGDRWGAARGASPVTLVHFRHYAATTMLDAGESYRTVADILGNSESTLRLHYDGRTDVGQEESHCGARARIIRAGMTPPPVCLDLSLSPETEALGRVKSG